VFVFESFLENTYQVHSFHVIR